MGRIRLAWIAAAISALGAIACALAPSIAALGIARFVSGATVGAMIPLAMAWIGDVVPYEHRQATIARFLIGNILGASLGAAAAGALGEHVGWRSVFALLFTGQSAGVWLCARAVDAWGVRPLYAVGATGLVVLALVFRSRLHRR